MAPIGRQNLRAELLQLVEKDEGVRRSLASVLSETAMLQEIAALRQDTDRRFEAMNERFEAMDKRFEAMLQEIAALRQDTDRRFEAMNERFEAMDKRFEAMLQEIAALRQDTDRRFEAINERFKAMDKRFEAINERFEAMDKRFEAIEMNVSAMREDLHRSITAIGSRWGIMTEESFRNAMRGLLARKFGIDIKKWIHYDKEGFVDGLPQQVEADLKVSDSEHILIEVKASVSKGDVSRFKRVGELYCKLSGVMPKLVLVTPFADPRGEALASAFGIEIYTHDYLPQEMS